MKKGAQPKSEEIAIKIRDAILLKKELSPGDRLPDERTMAIQFGVSRTSIREAVKTLEANGVLVIKKALGIFVAENPGMSSDPLGMSFMQDKKR
ncbi:FadR/GntR family transcriptional regulator [Sporomusa sp. KB1]|jgi:DNA-binding FadR family transcriptional regulator|uniref:FadR/GntR family transcriptional regulator n=1 Tax=Sporomusa sp. KB1 TaxID=943346 RepID=UPI00119E2F2A|nr:winged helix-turn-helix domain-containing protein [Sporomusa sp. KB1]TWH51894.1 GntR family transcriptional repressor for pyruvate dehydrogenase complex [Sporomusa sp. KB1]